MIFSVPDTQFFEPGMMVELSSMDEPMTCTHVDHEAGELTLEVINEMFVAMGGYRSEDGSVSVGETTVKTW